MSTHTPGPWQATTGHLVRVMAGADSVAGIHKIGRFTGGHDPRETIANAHLIAAAPDLLEALKILAEEASGFNVSGVYFSEDCMGHKGLKMAWEAIAKAEALP